MNGGDDGILKWVVGVVTLAGGTVFRFLHVRINRVEDKKLSKDVFEEFKEANENYHKATHKRLDDLAKKLDG